MGGGRLIGCCQDNYDWPLNRMVYRDENHEHKSFPLSYKRRQIKVPAQVTHLRRNISGCDPFRYSIKFLHTYIFINPKSRMTIQDAKTVSDEIEKGAKKN